MSTLASSAIAAVLELLTAAELEATDDAGALLPDPIGVLVGLPTLIGRGLASSSYTVPVTVVIADPLDGPTNRDRLYAAADAAADAIGVATYTPSNYRISGHAEPLASLELVATVTLSRLTEVSHAPD